LDLAASSCTLSSFLAPVLLQFQPFLDVSRGIKHLPTKVVLCHRFYRMKHHLFLAEIR
jgi:hypothetical protein